MDMLPVWDVDAQGYIDPNTGEILPTWDEALDDLDNLNDEDAEPVHVVRFGRQVHAQGVIAGSPDADTCLGYLSKYLTKQVHECHQPVTGEQSAHVDAFVDALRHEPCSPTCANWLRYGVQPKHPRPDMQPGFCKGKAHKREHLGYGGRRVLVSRKWSGKSMADHKHERRAWVLATLGETPSDDADRYLWHPVDPDDPDLLPLAHRLLRAVAQRTRWGQALDDAKARAAGQPSGDVSATEGVAA